jgi:hypothetical protein
MPNITKEQSQFVSAAMRKAKVNRVGIQKYIPYGESCPTHTKCGQCHRYMTPDVYPQASKVRARGDKLGRYFRCQFCWCRVALFRYHATVAAQKEGSE